MVTRMLLFVVCVLVWTAVVGTLLRPDTLGTLGCELSPWRALPRCGEFGEWPRW